MNDEKSKLSGDAQRRKFIETARALGCDENRERFEATLEKIAGHKPRSQETEAKVKRKRSKP